MVNFTVGMAEEGRGTRTLGERKREGEGGRGLVERLSGEGAWCEEW
jgi:hypothetical protein